jgi:hypothetical protein
MKCIDMFEFRLILTVWLVNMWCCGVTTLYLLFFFFVETYTFRHFYAIFSAFVVCILSIASNTSRILVTHVAVDLVVCKFFLLHLTRSTAA